MHSVQTIPTMHDPAKVYFTLVFFLLGILFLIYGPFAGYGRSIEFTVYDTICRIENIKPKTRSDDGSRDLGIIFYKFI